MTNTTETAAAGSIEPRATRRRHPRTLTACFVEANAKPGGSWHSAAELGAALRLQGALVHFVLPAGPAADESARRFGDQAVTAVRVRGRKARRDAMLAQAVRRFVRARHSVVHANTVSAVRPCVPGLFGMSVPLIVHLRNSASSFNERALLYGLMRTRRRTQFVAVSDFARGISGLPASRVRVISDPVAAPVARLKRERSDPVVIGATVTRRATKGFDLLVEVVRRTADRAVRFHVFGISRPPDDRSFVGSVYRRAQMYGVADRIVFEGKIPSLSAIYRSLDVVLITSRRESFGRVSIEAMRAGVPLVIPNIPGLLESTGGDVNAAVYSSEDPEAASAALSMVLDDEPDAQRRAEHARAHAEVYDPGRVASELADLYRTIGV